MSWKLPRAKGKKPRGSSRRDQFSLQIRLGMEGRLLVEGTDAGAEEKAPLVQPRELRRGHAGTGTGDFRRVRRREQESSRPQKALELSEPGVLRFLVEMSEDRDGEDHVEGTGRERRRRRLWNDLESSGQMPRRPLDLSAIDVDARVVDFAQAESVWSGGPDEVAGNAPTAAAEIEPATVELQRPAQLRVNRHQVAGTERPDVQKLGTRAVRADTMAQTRGRERKSGRSRETLAQIGDEILPSVARIGDGPPEGGANRSRHQPSDQRAQAAAFRRVNSPIRERRG